ncbi:MAG: hypothetical protein ACLP9L_05860 [Thermoguttaceae bacterium]
MLFDRDVYIHDQRYMVAQSLADPGIECPDFNFPQAGIPFQRHEAVFDMIPGTVLLTVSGQGVSSGWSGVATANNKSR